MRQAFTLLLYHILVLSALAKGGADSPTLHHHSHRPIQSRPFTQTFDLGPFQMPLLQTPDDSSLKQPWAPPAPTVPSSLEVAGVKLKLTNDAREIIQKDVNALWASEKYFKIKLDRVNLYFPIIERILKEENVPDDIKYLSVQESALISDAVSSSDAVGYWQFKDFTAKEVGMRVDSRIDERKNIVSSSRGAAKYFKRNNFYFNNWIYSVSAYQAGAGGAKKYVDPKFYGSSSLTITSKTHWYALRFIAHVIAFRDEIGHPHSEGLKLIEYQKGAGKSLSQIARELKVDLADIEHYNKWIKHGTVPDDKIYTVIIPVQGSVPPSLKESTAPPLAREMKDQQPKQYPEKITGGLAEELRTSFIKINGLEALMANEDDNMATLATRGGIQVTQFIRYNDLAPNDRIKPGQVYYMRNKRRRSLIRYHVIQHEESLWDISQKYGIRMKNILSKNRMDENDPLKPGRVLWLYKKRPSKTPIEYQKVTRPKPATPKIEPPKANPPKPKPEHLEKTTEGTSQNSPKQTTIVSAPKKEPVTIPSNRKKLIKIVKPGETLWGLSMYYGVSVQELTEWNNLTSNSLDPGQELTIYAPLENVDDVKSETKQKETRRTTQATIPEGNKISGNKPDIHEVAPGETLWGISRKYELIIADIVAWNGLSANEPLQPGQTLVLREPVPEGPRIIEYVVKGGDSLYKIAKEYGMTVTELMELNNLSSTSLSVGDILKVKVEK